MLKLQDLTVIYPDKTKAIENLSLTVNNGENIALIGENGAGKTSLLLGIVGILELAGGAVEIDGVQLSKKTVNEIRKLIGVVFQNPDDQLFMPLIFDDVAFGCRNHGLSEDKVKTKVEEVLAQLKISHLQNRSSLKLSGGEKRMAAIATVLTMNPVLLMFDEPTAFLDPRARRSLIDTLKNLSHTKIIATHDIAFAAELCNRVIVLHKGRIAADGGTDLLYSDILREYGLEEIKKVR